MRWNEDPKPPKWADWHRWFAWYPITVGTTRVWLEEVDRKGTEHCGCDQCVISWEYRLLEYYPC